MPVRPSLALLLALPAALFSAEPKPAYLHPNYTGPAAPTQILPDLDLPADRAFVHPGILLSQSDIDFVRARLAAKEEPWTSALAAMRAGEFCRLDYAPRIIPVIDPHDNSVGYLMKDGAAAYGHAVLWTLTGERAHADKAVEILDHAAATLKEIAIGRHDHGKGNGSITHYIHAHGQNQESGRDQIHGQMGLGALAAAAEMAKKQGIDLYAVADNRLAAGYEHMAKYLCGHDVEITGDVPISPKGRDRAMPVWELVHQHYVVEKGLDLPFVSRVVATHRPEGVDLIVHSAWGTLLHYRGPALAKP